MNRVYRLVWNAAKGMFVAVQEGARGNGGKTGTTRIARRRLASNALLCGMAALFSGSALHAAPAANELPTSGTVVGGSAAISQNASTLTVRQDSQRAAVDWATFNVGSAAKVDFVQPNAGAVILNRVQGSQPSEIFGKINANGQVFLVNPNGVFFAPGASVDVGGLVATTHKIALDDFMAGKYRFERSGSTSSVVNAGDLKAAIGGYIAMLAPEVRNEGVVVAHTGTVALVAGEAVTLQIGGSNTLAGLTVTAAQVKSLVENRNLILAPGGLVVMSAQAAKDIQGWVVNSGGRIEATGMAMKAGRIVLDASQRVENSGVLTVDAAVLAKAADGSTVAGGPAGTIAVSSGKDIVFSGTASARATDGGKGGEITLNGAASVKLDGATLDASGKNAGGSVRITGGSVEATGGTRILVASEMGQGGQIAVAAAQSAVLGALTRLDAAGALGGGAVMLDAGADAVLDGATLTTWGGEGKGGTVSVTATQSVQLDGTLLDASGALGGDVLIQAGLSTKLSDAVLDASGKLAGGYISVRSTAPQPLPQEPRRDWPSTTELLGNTWLRAGGGRGRGGKVVAEGSLLVLDGTTKVDATGDAGGGQVLLGGGWQGSDPSIQASKTVYVGREVVVDASALLQGDGGTVVVWSDAHLAGTSTVVHGTLKAKGGEQGGDGGRIETSGYWLDVAGITADASAQNGKGGEWLLDPYNLTVSGAATTTTTAGGPPYEFTSGAGGTNVLNTDIQTQLNGGTSVTLQTSGADGDGFGNGDITVSANISKTAGGDATLLLKAHRDIVLSNGISISGSGAGKLHVTFNSDSDAIAGGMIYLVNNSSISSNGGNITLGGGTNIATGYAQGRDTTGTDIYGNGIFMDNNSPGPTLTSGGGDITLRGRGAAYGGGAWWSFGAVVNGPINAGSGKISITGVANAADNTSQRDQALNFQGQAVLTSVSTAADSITLVGDASASNGTQQMGITGGISIDNTAGGGIVVTGLRGSTTGQAIPNGMSIGSAGTTGPITLIANDFSTMPSVRSTGALTILSATPGTTIGIGSGAGTLNIAAGYFTSKFVNGFSSITIGDGSTGTITVGGAVTINDQLTLKSADNIVFDASSSLTGTAGQTAHLTLWSDADASGGGVITLGGSAVISTNGGDITFGGGANPLTGYATGNAIDVHGVVLSGSSQLLSAGGNITLRGKSASGGSGGNGIFGSGGVTINSGVGAIAIEGVTAGDGSASYNHGFEFNFGGGTTTITSAKTTGTAISLIGDASATGNSVNQGTGVGFFSAGNTVSATGGGDISILGRANPLSTPSNNRYGAYLNGANILASTGAITIDGGSNGLFFTGGNSYVGFKVATSVTSSTSNITLISDALTLQATDRLQSSGALTIRPFTQSATIGIAGGAGTLALPASYFSTNFVVGFSAGGISVGRPDGTGAITVGALAVNDGLTILSDSAPITVGSLTTSAGLMLLSNTGLISLTGTLTSTGPWVTFASGGGATETGVGTLTANSLELVGPGAFVLNAATNSVGTIAANVGSLSFVNNGALAVGLVGGTPGVTAMGAVSITTGTGDITVSQNITTADITSSAIVLNAGESTAAGTATGGNIVISGGSISPGAGGRATLFSGSVAGSTGLTALVGSASGNFRYNSDEFATNYGTALANGVFAIYREQPTVTVTAANVSKVYDGAAYSGNAGVSYFGLVNGDASIAPAGSLLSGGTSQGAVNVGGYTIAPSGLTSDLGYALVFANGTLTVTQAPLTVTANSTAKLYDGLAYFGNAGVAYTGFVNGETSAVLGGALSVGGASQGAVDQGVYAFTPTGLTAANYALSFVDGTLTISPPNSAPPVATITPTIITPIPGSTGSSPPPLTVVPEPTVEPTLPPPPGFVEPVVVAVAPTTSSTEVVTTDIPVVPTTGNQVTTTSTPVVPRVTTAAPLPVAKPVVNSPLKVTSVVVASTTTPTDTDTQTNLPNEPITTVGTVQPAVTLEIVPPQSEVITETIVTTGVGGGVSNEVVLSVMRTVSQTDNPAQALDALTSSRVAAAVSSGMDKVQAEQAGVKHGETVANLLAIGVPLAEAMTRAEQVFQAEASFPPPKSPAESVVNGAATSGDTVGMALTSLAQAKTPAGSDAFDKALAVNLAKGVPFGAAVTAAEVAVKQADALAAADTTPQVKLAKGDAGAEKRSEVFDRTMGALLAKGFTPEQAIQRAQLAESNEAAAKAADAKPSNALAMGNVQALPKGKDGAKFDQAMGVAMLKGVSVEEAIQRAKAADEFERQVNEAETRNPASGISTGKLATEQENPIFDRVLSLALARGEPPEKAMLLAKMAAERASGGPQTIRTALASGVKVEELLLTQGGSRIYRMVLGNALAKGVPPDEAIAMAKRAERANAFRWVLPKIAALKLQSAGALKVALEGGAALPSWLVFTAANSEFYAVDVPEGGMPLKVVLSAGAQKITVLVKERKDNAAVSGKGG